MMMRPIPGIILLLGCIQLSGCAFGTRYVELSYPPQEQVETSPSATEPVAAGPRTEHIILTVTDDRDVSDRIGNIRNSFGQDTASILTESNVPVWVHDAIAFDLDRAGYQVLGPFGASPNEPADRLTARVQKVNCDIYMVYDGEVSLQVTLERPGQQPLTTEYSAQVNSGVAWALSGEAAGQSLAQALQTVIQNMLRDIGFTD